MRQQYPEREDLIGIKTQDNTNIRKTLVRYLKLWPFFLVSLALCLSLSFLYLQFAEPVYVAVASLMVKDEKKGPDLVYNSALKEIGIGGSAKLVENEIEVLKSYDLIEVVVDTLQLFVSVKKVGDVKDVSVFIDEFPFIIKVLNPEHIQKTLQWKVTDTISGILLQHADNKRPTLIRYNQLHTVDGINFRLSANPLFVRASGVKPGKLLMDYNIIISPREQTILNYSRKLIVEAASKLATVINLEIKDTNKKKAAAVLETLIAIYKFNGIENKNLITENTIEFLNDRLAFVASELLGVEGNVERFKSANKVTDLSTDAQQYLAISQQVDAQKAEIQTQLNIISALENNLSNTQENPQLVPSTFGIQDNSLNQLIDRHNDLVLQHEKLQQKTGPKNPLLVDQQTQIKELRSRMLLSVRNLKQANTIALQDISVKDAQMSSRIRNVPQLEKRLVQITRNQTVQEQLYAFLLQKREEAAASRASDMEESTVIVKARGLNPVSPKPTIIWAFGFLMGLMIPAAFFGAKDFLNTRIGDMNEVRQKINLPIIGSVSHIKKNKTPILINNTSRSAVAEEIRNLRTAISFTGKGEAVKTILVTSFQVGDGKSFLSLNIAASYAVLGKRAVILEFDLRKPRIAKLLKISVSDGISSILSGKFNTEDLMVEIPDFKGNLFIVPAGYVPPNPAELIAGPVMESFIRKLQEKFDYVIIDTPPISLVADASLLQKYADITLIVLRQNYTNKNAYTELKHKLTTSNSRSTYLILNDVEKNSLYHSGYGKGYYHDGN